jgi:hypothetical protein
MVLMLLVQRGLVMLTIPGGIMRERSRTVRLVGSCKTLKA